MNDKDNSRIHNQDKLIQEKYEYYAETEEPPGEAKGIRLEKIRNLRARGIEIYGSRYEKNINISDIREKYCNLTQGEPAGQDYRVAGRVMIFRKHGKATFCDLKDSTGKIQLYVSLKNIGDKPYEEFSGLDIGDWIGVEGGVFVTRTGELSINVNSFELLSKAIRVLPEKWHGLKDKELRYRQRYLDFTVNPDVMEVFRTRIKAINALREFLNGRGFLEVETPMLQPIPGGAAARPFITHHNALDLELYLRIAPELYLKRLIIGGFEKVYELNRSFRNEGISHKHNPEFTMVEFYQAFCDYRDMMDLTEELIKFIASKTAGTMELSYRGKKICLDGRWKRYTMLGAIEKFGNIKIDFETGMEDLLGISGNLGIQVNRDSGKGKIINEIFESVVEPLLIQPTFIMDYPIEISPLAKKHPENENLTERFELFIGGEEIANAFSELIDPAEQLKRFRFQVKSSDEEERITGKIDTDFLKAMEYGMPPTGGEGIGIDRLVMILTDSNSIRDVILFPLLRPEE
ncbi:MAG: lysine--tRNA ligase [Actinobacteria bacterium]|nr:lysine--tRNA ligase [Actinomycetota bacterium]